MKKPFEIHGVEAEKAEAMRRYNNRSSFRNILRLAAVASLCYLWFPTVVITLQTAGDWIYRAGAVFITDRSVVFVIANLIVALIFLLSGEMNNESNIEPESDLYGQYTSSSSSVIVTASASASVEKVVEDDDSNKQIVTASASGEKVVEDDDDDSNKQIVPAFITEVEDDQANREAVTTTRIYRRTKSETKKEIIRPVMEYRRTESAKVVAMERLSSEEFRLKVESFIMEKKRSLIQENDVVRFQGLRTRPVLIAAASGSGYGSC